MKAVVSRGLAVTGIATDFEGCKVNYSGHRRSCHNMQQLHHYLTSDTEVGIKYFPTL